MDVIDKKLYLNIEEKQYYQIVLYFKKY